MSETENRRHDVLDELVCFGAGFKDGERLWVLEALSAVVPHLARWDPDDIDVEISVKDRDGKRVADRLKPLELVAGKFRNSDSREFSHLIAQYRS